MDLGTIGSESHLTLVCARVLEVRLFEPEYPVLGLGHVNDLEALVVGEEGVAIGQNVKVSPTKKRNLKQPRKWRLDKKNCTTDITTKLTRKELRKDRAREKE